MGQGREPNAREALASQQGSTLILGPQVCGSHGCIRMQPPLVIARAQGSSSSGFQGYGSVAGVKEAAGLAGYQRLLQLRGH